MTTTYNGKIVTIVKNKQTGERAVKVEDKGYVYRVPLAIAALATGKDAWMRSLKCKCSECGDYTTIGATDYAGTCDVCVEEMFAEMEQI